MEPVTQLAALVATDFNGLAGGLIVHTERGYTFRIERVEERYSVTPDGADKAKTFPTLKKARDWMRKA
jgi:hypothetical protein